MAIHVNSVDGMGAVTEPSAGVFQTTGMGEEDHNFLANNLFEVAGVNKKDDYEVTENGSPDMSVNVNTGQMLAKNDSYAENSTSQTKFYGVTSDSIENVGIDTADPSQDRIDLVAMKKNTNTPNDDGDNIFELVSSADDNNLKGTPAASPVAPTPSGNYTILAQVLVGSSVTSISNANITDRRIFFNPNRNGGWLALSGDPSFSSDDDPTFVMSVNGDISDRVNLGTRIRLKQGTSFKYFIVTKISVSGGNTTLTLFGGTDYNLANDDITDLYFSNQRVPVGMPMDVDKWTVEATDTTARTETNPTTGTWYNLGNFSLDVPIGKWNLSYSVNINVADSDATPIEGYTTLSTSNNSESNSKFTTYNRIFVNLGSTTKQLYVNTGRELPVTLTTKDTYYLLSMTNQSNFSIANQNDDQTAIIKAVCQYL